MQPGERLKRLRDIQLAAAEQRRAEARDECDDRIAARIYHLRLRELQDWLMTGIEIMQRRRLERENEKDREDYRSGDWTK